MDGLYAGLSLYIPGKERAVSAEVLLKTLAKALDGISLTEGYHNIEQDKDGRVYLNDELVFTPKRVVPRERNEFVDNDSLLDVGYELGAIITRIDK